MNPDTIAAAIVSSVITGGITLIGVIIQNNKQMAIIQAEINHIKENLTRFEKKQDVHNGVISRTFQLETRQEAFDKRLSLLEGKV